MPTVTVKLGRRRAVLTFGGDYKPGDPAPTGYLDWHEWAEVQHKAGLRQAVCGSCGLWHYPQEFSDQVRRSTPRNRFGEPVPTVARICLKCAQQGKQRGDGQ